MTTTQRDAIISNVANYILQQTDGIIDAHGITRMFGLTISEFDEAFNLAESRAETMYFRSHPELNP